MKKKERDLLKLTENQYKYCDSKIVKVIELYDPTVWEFLNSFNVAVQLADDVMDHRIETDNILDVFSNMYNCMRIAPKGLLEKINPAMETLILAERYNQCFIPGKLTNEEEIEVIRHRTTLPIYFESLCYVDPSFDTDENREWINKYFFTCVKANDCLDILNGVWEDFILCRRNYVALSCFGPDIYSTWRDKKEELYEKAKNIWDSFKIDDPIDKRLNMFIKED